MQRFWVKVDKNGPIPQHKPSLGPCFVWTAGTNSKGYGKFAIGNRRWMLAHRWVWEQRHGPLRPGGFVLHKCDNPACVRLGHLYEGTIKDNNRDAADRHTRANCKLTSRQVASIRRSYSGSYGEVVSLARQFNVHRDTISRIVHQRSWR